MLFAWDPRKAASNLAKHGVTFEDSASVFWDPHAVTFADPLHSLDETREVTIGRGDSGVILCVVHVTRADTIRIVTARRATLKEQDIYENG